MSPLQCLIIDDEPVARKVIREYIEDTDFLALLGEAENPVKAGIMMQEKHTDLVFLDIQMPRMSGIDFLKTAQSLPMAVITTAYPEYALQGFELDVLDYLIKPIGFDRFLKAAHKAREYHQMKTGGGGGDPEFMQQAFFIKCDRKIEKIVISDIVYVQALANYVVIHTQQRKYVTYITFKGIEERLPQDSFVRIHKSYLVALSAISNIDHNKVSISRTILPLSKHYKQQAMEKIRPFVVKK